MQASGPRCARFASHGVSATAAHGARRHHPRARAAAGKQARAASLAHAPNAFPDASTRTLCCRSATTRFKSIWRRQHRHRDTQEHRRRKDIRPAPEPAPTPPPRTTDGASPQDESADSALSDSSDVATPADAHAASLHAHHHCHPHAAPHAQRGALQHSPVAGVPVFVMLPLDTVGIEIHGDGSTRSVVQNVEALQQSLRNLKAAGVTVRAPPLACPAQV